MSPDIAILHVCPHCKRVFDSPSICVEGECETVPTPSYVSPQQARDLGLRDEPTEENR
jgi:hypothetical protein